MNIKKNNLKLNLFSGIQPSGIITIGNYIGVIQEWIKYQNKFNSYYCIADLHSLNNKQSYYNNYNKIEDKILDTLSIIISSGIDPYKNCIFLQSKVLEHTQLMWLLSCYTSLSKIKNINNIKYFLNKKDYNLKISTLNYSLLMISDIILYETDLVIVGKDQTKNMELCKYIINKINNKFKYKFKIPNTHIKENSYIMSLTNSNIKMSKSDLNKNNFISILDDKITIFNKIKNCITDSDINNKIYFDIKNKPEISNLLKILSNFDNISLFELENSFINKDYLYLKHIVSNSIYNKLQIIQDKYYKIRNNKKYLIEILEFNSEIAKNIAKISLNKFKNIIGFL